MQRAKPLSAMLENSGDSKDAKSSSAAATSKMPPEYKFKLVDVEPGHFVLMIDSDFNPNTYSYDKRYHFHLFPSEFKQFHDMKVRYSEDNLIKFLSTLSSTRHREILDLQKDRIFHAKLRNVKICGVNTPSDRAATIRDSLLREDNDGSGKLPFVFPHRMTDEEIEAKLKDDQERFDKKKSPLRPSDKKKWKEGQDNWKKDVLDKRAWTDEAWVGLNGFYYPDKIVQCRKNSLLFDNSPSLQETEDGCATPVLSQGPEISSSPDDLAAASNFSSSSSSSSSLKRAVSNSEDGRATPVLSEEGSDEEENSPKRIKLGASSSPASGGHTIPQKARDGSVNPTSLPPSSSDSKSSSTLALLKGALGDTGKSVTRSQSKSNVVKQSGASASASLSSSSSSAFTRSAASAAASDVSSAKMDESQDLESYAGRKRKR